MIGQKKRPLEVSVAPLPVKCRKHTNFSRHEEAINGQMKADAENLKTSSFLETHALTEPKQQFLLDESSCLEEAKKALLAKQPPSPFVYHGGSTANKQSELSKIAVAPEKTDHFSCSSALVHPTHLWLPSPSRHALDQNHETDEFCTTVMPESFPERLLHRKKVPIGSDFQADIPVWEAGSSGRSGIAEGGDDRWLGSQVWPLPESTKIQDESRIGKGRAGFCSCIHQGSVACIQMHVHEKTIRLKMELGKAYQLLGFDQMGERVSEQWMEEDEYRFKFLVKLNPVSLGRNFWHMLPFAFPTKTPRDFVSYYFNVFVLRRRAIQNRFDPENIDSDDDECELTDSDSDDSDGYETDEEGGESDQDDSDEDKSDYDWEETSENQQTKTPESSTFWNSELTNPGHWSTLSDSQCNQSTGADNLQPDRNADKNDYLHSDIHHWMPINFTPDTDPHPKLELSPSVKESNFCKDHSFMQRSSIEMFNPDLWVGYMDIIPRKGIDKLISTTGLITELFGDGAREADLEKKVSGHRLSSFISNGWIGE